MASRKVAKHDVVVEARIEQIAEMMRQCKWKRRTSVRELAKEWGLSEISISIAASKASQKVMGELEDPERLTTKIGTTLEKIVEQGFEEKNYKAVIEASKVLMVLVARRQGDRYVHGAGFLPPTAEIMRQDQELARLAQLAPKTEGENNAVIEGEFDEEAAEPNV